MRKLVTWVMLSAGVKSGCVRQWWQNSTVSETEMALDYKSTTLKQKVIEGRANVVAVASLEGPCGAFVGFGVNDDLAANGAKGCCRVVKGKLMEI